MTHIPNGALVRMPDGSIARAYPDLDDTYRTAQPSGHSDHGVRVDLGWRREQLEVVTPEPRTKVVSHRLIKHAAHYMHGHPDKGHDLEQWITETAGSIDRPSYEERIAIGIAPDADYGCGHIENGSQRWTWVAKRPFSPERCERCFPEQTEVR